MIRGDDKATKLRTYIARHDLRRRTPRHIKIEAVEYATARHADGRSFGEIARELGMHERTLTRWSTERAVAVENAAFRDVAVVGDVVSQDSRLLVTLPNGLRIEGSDVVRISALIRRLS